MSSRKKQSKQWAFKAGARFSVAPDLVGAELERIQKTNGVTHPKAVVDASRPEQAPLHPVFEWRDEVAAESYRVWQARKLIKSVRVIEADSEVATQAAYYVHVPSANAETAAGYQPMHVVVQQPDMYASALAELARKVSAAKDSLEALRRAAEQAPETDTERMTRIAIAVQAMQTASAAVQALH